MLSQKRHIGSCAISTQSVYSCQVLDAKPAVLPFRYQLCRSNPCTHLVSGLSLLCGSNITLLWLLHCELRCTTSMQVTSCSLDWQQRMPSQRGIRWKWFWLEMTALYPAKEWLADEVLLVPCSLPRYHCTYWSPKQCCTCLSQGHDAHACYGGVAFMVD